MADEQAPWWTRPPEPATRSAAGTAQDTQDDPAGQEPEELEVRRGADPGDTRSAAEGWSDRDEALDRTELMDLTGRPERVAAAEAFGTEPADDLDEPARREEPAAEAEPATEAFGQEAFDQEAFDQEAFGTEEFGTEPRPMNGHALHDEPATEAFREPAPPTETLREPEPAAEAFHEPAPGLDLPFGAGPPQPGVRRTVPPPSTPPGFDPPVQEWGDPEYGEGVYGWEDPAGRPVPPPGPVTEQLPRVPADHGDPSGPDTLGVYGAPSGVAPGIPGLSGDADPLVHLRQDTPPRQLKLPAGLPEKLPGGPRLLAAVGGVLAVLLVVLAVRGLFGGGDEDPADQATTAGSTAAAQDAAGGGPAVDRISSATAGAALKKAGQTGNGKVMGAWTWEDDNGKNMLVTLQRAKGDNSDLRVVFLSKFDQDKPVTQRVMQEPNVPNCRGEGTAAFTKNSVQVRDVDKDGRGEVTVGWASRCGGKSESSVAKLALLTGKDKYILRGEGVVGESGSGGTTPDPKSSNWPKGYLKPLTEQFRKLYF